jgi:hypothetical protein
MAAIGRVPENTDLLQPTKYILTFDRLPSMQYFCQEVNIPGISIGTAEFATPILNLKMPGTKINYENLNITFLVDQNLNSWNEIYKWFRNIASPESIEQRDALSTTVKMNGINAKKYNYESDATLSVLTNMNRVNFKIHFLNIYPISLTGINFNTTLSADEVIKCSATFNFDYFNII